MLMYIYNVYKSIDLRLFKGYLRGFYVLFILLPCRCVVPSKQLGLLPLTTTVSLIILYVILYALLLFITIILQCYMLTYIVIYSRIVCMQYVYYVLISYHYYCVILPFIINSSLSALISSSVIIAHSIACAFVQSGCSPMISVIMFSLFI